MNEALAVVDRVPAGLDPVRLPGGPGAGASTCARWAAATSARPTSSARSGAGMGIAVMAADIGKGVAAVLIAPRDHRRPLAGDRRRRRDGRARLPGLAALQGRQGRRGGRRGASSALMPLASRHPARRSGCVVVVATRYTSLGQHHRAPSSRRPLAWALGLPLVDVVFAAIAAVAVLVLHRGNLVRLVARPGEPRSSSGGPAGPEPRAGPPDPSRRRFCGTPFDPRGSLVGASCRSRQLVARGQPWRPRAPSATGGRRGNSAPTGGPRMGSSARRRVAHDRRGELPREFLGTFVLIAFGCGVVAMYVAACPESGRGDGIITDGDWLLITFGLGHGGHLRHLRRRRHQRRAHQPRRDDRLRRLRAASRGPRSRATSSPRSWARSSARRIVYAQLPGRHPGLRGRGQRVTRDGAGTVGIFVTGPAGYFDNYWGPVISEVTGTAFLLIFVFAVVDLMNLPPKANLGAAHHRLGRVRHRHVLRRELGLRDQPGPRLRAAHVRLARWGGATPPSPATPGQPDAATGGCPSSRRSSARSSAAIFYDFFITDVLKARHGQDDDRPREPRRGRGGRV